MQNEKTIFITTPIYYVNDVPHIGHAYTTIAADVYARYWRNKNKSVFLLTGTDEHGQKIEEYAAKAGKQPKEFTDEIVAQYKRVWQMLNISNDGFIRTTDAVHEKTVQRIFEMMYAKGDIYKGSYKGWYCVPCESYFLGTELKEHAGVKNSDGNGDGFVCPDCGRPLSLVEEDAYFFRLSKYQNDICKHYENNPSFLAPQIRKNEMINFVKSGLKDLCVSRSAVRWGIPVPWDPRHSIYVWFDALINYISAIGYLDFLDGKNNAFATTWPADVHFVGKEIFKFHSVIWPAMLMSLGLPIPHTVFGHGWWTAQGEKMSKSKGNMIDPCAITAEFGTDALRYFLLREVPFGVDGDFSMHQLVVRYNAELANDVGNLVSRTLTMVHKYCNGKIPDDVRCEANVLWEKSNSTREAYTRAMESFAFSDALEAVNQLVRTANKYIEDSAPWKLAKDTTNPDATKQLHCVLFNLCATLRCVAYWLQPVMPTAAARITQLLGLDHSDDQWDAMPRGGVIEQPSPLFPRKEL